MESKPHHVLELLERNGVPVRQFRTTIADVLGITYHKAARKIRNNGPWSVDELKRILDHFGESLDDYIGAASNPGVSAILEANGQRIPVRLWIGETIFPKGQRIAALRTSDGMVVRFGSDIIDDENIPVFSVLKMDFDAEKLEQARVAILDDEILLAESIAQELTKNGLEAVPFSDERCLEKCLEDFDAFILDWVLKERTSRELVLKIRTLSKVKQIIILTGKTLTGQVHESDIAAMIGRYSVDFAQKPLAIQVIAEKIRSAYQKGELRPIS